jgi:hypothetical protein
MEKRMGGRGKSPGQRCRRPRKRSAREKIKQRERGRKNRGEREIRFPKDLCINLENCRDLSIKHKFPINLKP